MKVFVCSCGIEESWFMRRIFISFIIEDENSVTGLRLLARKNPAYSDLEFYDESVRVPINGVDSPYIKRKIKRCGAILCLISGTIHTSSWPFYYWDTSKLKAYLDDAVVVR